MDTALKRNYWLVTLADQVKLAEVVYRSESMALAHIDLIKIKKAGAETLGNVHVLPHIIHTTYLGFMSEEEFMAGVEEAPSEPNVQK